jgi:type VI secretion system protein ImpF
VADLTPKERLQPSLLDRLADDEPDKRQESADKRILSLQRLREGVRRDLTWLLNTPNLATVQDLENYPEVAGSTLNFGIPDLAGRTSTRRWWPSSSRPPSWPSSRASSRTR